MYSYSEQLKTIKKFKVKEGQSERFNCPFCNGYNTLGVSVINGKLEWNCFKASCPAHGVHDEGSSIEGLKVRLNNTEEPTSYGKPIPFLADLNNECIDFLKKYNSYEAYDKGYANIRYAPSENRIMFGIGKNLQGFSGRRLGLYGPKWVKYGDASNLFTCGTGAIGVLVEDAPSACAVGVLPDYTGVSLLGTVLTQKHKLQLIQSFQSILICLDPDAAKKSLTLKSKLEGFIPTSIRFIPDDLKYFNSTQIKEILNDYS